MVVNAVTIKSSSELIEGAYPIGTALIFTTNDADTLYRALSTYSAMTAVEYAEWREINKSRVIEEHEPVGCVTFSDHLTKVTVDLDYKR